MQRIGVLMEKKDLLYEGKAKKVFTTDNEDVLMVSYKDDATAFNGEKKGTIVGKGIVNNRMANHIFKMLEEKGIPTHLIEEINDRETYVKKVEIVPLEVIIRNVAAGSFSKKLGIVASDLFNYIDTPLESDCDLLFQFFLNTLFFKEI